MTHDKSVWQPVLQHGQAAAADNLVMLLPYGLSALEQKEYEQVVAEFLKLYIYGLNQKSYA